MGHLHCKLKDLLDCKPNVCLYTVYVSQIQMHTYFCTYMRNAHKYKKFVNKCTHTHIHTYIHTYIHTHTHARTRARTHTHTHTLSIESQNGDNTA